jgi:large subunit ribosomal protein L29
MPKNENFLGPKTLRERNDSELRSLLAQKAEDLHKASFKHKLGQLRETHTIRAIKKDIARINTVLRERSKS